MSSNKVNTIKRIFFLLCVLLSLSNENIHAQTLSEDSIALVVLYDSLNGESWGINWMDARIRDWEGVTVWQDRVTGLTLDGTINGNVDGDIVIGTIPSEFNSLGALEKIVFNDIQIDGIINLEFFANLTKIEITKCLTKLDVIGFEHSTDLDRISLNGITVSENVQYENLNKLLVLKLVDLNLDFLAPTNNLVDLIIFEVQKNNLSVLPDLSANVDITSVNFSENPISEIPDLSGLNGITQLYLSDMGIITLPNLSDFPLLDILSAENNNISQVPDLSNNTAIRNINLSNNKLTSFPSFAGLSALQILDLSDNEITEMPDLSPLISLNALILQDNLIETLVGIDNLTNASTVLLSNNKIRVLEDITNLTSLQLFGIGFNELEKLPKIATGLIGVSYMATNNKFSFRELANFDDTGIDNFGYSNQQPDNSITIVGTPIFGNSVTLSMDEGGDMTSIDWISNSSITETVNYPDTILVLDSISLLDKGNYSCQISNSQFPNTSYITEPIFLQILGEDSLGGLYIYDQLMVEYEADASQGFRDSLRSEFDATLIDQCLCGEFLELWELDLLGLHPIELDSLGTLIYITDPDEIKKKTKRKTRVNEADFNYPMNLNSSKSVSLIAQQRVKYNAMLAGPPLPSSPPVDQISLILIDTGIDSLHDLEEYYWINPEVNDTDNCLFEDIHGYNFAEDNSNTIENDNGHGTHLAGIITENLGLQNDFSIINAKAFGNDGYGELFDAICSVYYGIDQEADIYNLSWGYYGAPVHILENALRRTDALLISSAGNGIDGMGVDISQDSTMHFPGSFDLENMITVAAWDADSNDIASFSNFNDSLVHIAALGVDINPSIDYNTKSGTSQAAAAVSAAALCLKIDNPEWGYAELKSEILREVNISSALAEKTIHGGVLGSCITGVMVSTDKVKAIPEKQKLRIFPNPISDIVYIQAKEMITSYKVFDTNGHLILKCSQLDSLQIQIDTKDLQRGIYFIEVITTKDRYIEKLIKQD